MGKIDTGYFPGWVRKSLTFTIDDGNLPMDRKFLQILSPAGIRGTFNLCSDYLYGISADELREFYLGYEISNHCKHHPFAFSDGEEYRISDTLFDMESSDPELVHQTGTEGIYMIHFPRGWRGISPAEHYCRFADEGRQELEKIFGIGSIGGYVWPYHEQDNHVVVEHLKNSGYYGIRKTGCLGSSTGFSLPADRYGWSYNADHNLLLTSMAEYDACPDDGKLKFFAFGVHSKDYETFDKWDDLRRFAELYGNRSDEYYYATVGEIFAYEDAVKSSIMTESSIQNTSNLTLYVKVDGVPLVVAPGETLHF